jgi:hypothetical protein
MSHPDRPASTGTIAKFQLLKDKRKVVKRSENARQSNLTFEPLKNKTYDKGPTITAESDPQCHTSLGTSTERIANLDDEALCGQAVGAT